MEETTVSAILGEFEESFSQLADLPTNAAETNEYLRKLIDLVLEFAVTYGGKIIIALVILIVGFKLAGFLTKKLFSAKAMNKLEHSTKSFLQSLVGIILKILVGITVLAVIGVPMTSMVAVISSCGLAIGLALQGSLSNIAGGFILLVFKPFSEGDYVIASGVEGTVENLGVFHTRIITVDNKRVTVPNSVISNATLTNVTALEKRRVDLTFTASYDNDIDKVERTLLKVACEHELVFSDPAPFARLSSHKDSALEYTVRVWCKTEDYHTVYFDLIKNVKKAFDKEGISIPYMQLQIHTGK